MCKNRVYTKFRIDKLICITKYVSAFYLFILDLFNIALKWDFIEKHILKRNMFEYILKHNMMFEYLGNWIWSQLYLWNNILWAYVNAV